MSWEIPVSVVVSALVLASSYVFQLIYKQKISEKNNKEKQEAEIKKVEIAHQHDSSQLNLLVDFAKDAKSAFAKEKENNLREEIKKEFEWEKNSLIDEINRKNSKISILEEEKRDLVKEKDWMSNMINSLKENQKNYSLFINFYDSCRSWGLSDTETLKDFITYWRDNKELIDQSKLNASKNKKDGPMSGKLLEKEWENIFKQVFSIWMPHFVDLSKQPKNQLGQKADFLIRFYGARGHIDEGIGSMKILIELKTSNISKKSFNGIECIRELEKQVTKLLEETRYNTERFDIALFIVGERVRQQLLHSQECIWIGIGQNENPNLENWRIEGDPILVFTSYEFSHIFLKNLFHSWWLFSQMVSHKLLTNIRKLRQFEERIPNINRQILSYLDKVNDSKNDYFEKLQEIIGKIWKLSEEWRQWIVKKEVGDENLKVIKNQMCNAIDWVKVSSIQHDKRCKCETCQKERWIKKCKEGKAGGKLVVWGESNNELIRWKSLRNDNEDYCYW
ncbi:hypothetical protein [Mycoplasma suis]|uniref:Uncharacterized protein n=1 Tax=Mycoplasma suis (strain Illinois) TaxID=768700 RepID=F0QQX2_MYCSL|nr:hypothetical protein [Mycoplasma suis]ADX97892.1 hypothetical protein MSU_0352 [Mycoplasma suis str. Illinois]